MCSPYSLQALNTPETLLAYQDPIAQKNYNKTCDKNVTLWHQKYMKKTALFRSHVEIGCKYWQVNA